MSFNEEIKPYEEALDKFRTAKIWKEGVEVQRALRDIYIKYIWVKGQKLPCSTCNGSELAQMFNQINRMRDGLIQQPEQSKEELRRITKEELLKDVPDLELVEEIPATQAEVEMHLAAGVPIVDLNKLDLEGLRLECKRRGIKYHHLHKEKKLRELLA